MEEELNSSTLISEEIENEEEETSEEITQEEETSVEETPKTGEEVKEEEPQGKFYTDEEFNQKVNEIADRRVARKMRKLERELDKYKDTENVLKSQLGGETIDEVNDKLRNLYTNEGVELPERYVSEDSEYIEYQADRDSKDIITEGYESMREEANKLANIGYDNLSKKDQLVFNKLVNALNEENDKRALRSLNIDESILEDNSFKEYRNQFNSSVPITKIYEMYNGTKEEKQINTPSDLTNNSELEKDFFTDEEIEKMTDEELEANWEKVRMSQTKNN